ncbi:MAG: hypothetical protein ACHP78_18975 [Terriglobales bacterium]
MTITCDGCGVTNLTTAIKTEGGWLCRNCDRERADANAQETKDGWPRLTVRIKVPEQKTTVTASDKLDRRRWKK